MGGIWIGLCGMVNGDKDWEITCYRSLHPCWLGMDIVVLPRMGFLIWNDVVWSYLNIHDFDLATGKKVFSLNEHLKKEVVGKKREIFMHYGSTGRNLTILIGMRSLFSEINRIWYLQTGEYGRNYMNLEYTLNFDGRIVDCGSVVRGKVMIVQRLFRRKKWEMEKGLRSENFRKVRVFKECVRCLPEDVMDCVVGAFFGRHGWEGRKIEMVVVETELFRQFGMV